MQRLLSTGLIFGLLIATAAAFAITESLKLTQSPITRTQVTKVLSPVCRCDKRAAKIRFWLRSPDTLTLDIVDSGRHEVKRLADGILAHRRWNTFKWDGRTDSGAVTRDGTYYARVHLAAAHRTIQLPNPMQLDTKAPRVVDAKPNRTVFSPDGDFRADSVKIHYKFSEDANAVLYLDGKLLVRTRFAARSGSLRWYGRVNNAVLPKGTYRLRLGAVDVAGNATDPRQRKEIVVRVRYIELARHTIRGIKVGTRFGVLVDTDAKSYRWRLDANSGRSKARALVVRAPSLPGRYRLVVTENGHSDFATVVVVPR